jgi:hypothetical protein
LPNPQNIIAVEADNAGPHAKDDEVIDKSQFELISRTGSTVKHHSGISVNVIYVIYRHTCNEDKNKIHGSSRKFESVVWNVHSPPKE